MIGLEPPFSDGACRNVDPDVFFPSNGNAVITPRRICGACPRLVECRDWILGLEKRLGERQAGVWASMSERERPKPKPVLCRSGRHRIEDHGEITAAGVWRCGACRSEAQARSDAKKVAARSAASKQSRQESGYSWMDEVDAPWAS